MGSCNDASVKFLRNLGYNVIRHPNAGINPLDLIGVQNGESLYLGPLNLLITNPPGPLPAITRDTVAADINGQKSSALKFGIGVNVLGSVISAMGGNLGVGLNFTKARQMVFSYSDVLNDSVVPLEVGNYLRAADVDEGNLILKEYVLGNGDLYLITRTAKSNKLTVSFEKSAGVAASIDVPVIQGVAGGDLKLDTSSASGGKLTFSGPQKLVFAFQAFHIGVEDGVLSIVAVEAGGVSFGVGDPDEPKPTLIGSPGLLRVARF